MNIAIDFDGTIVEHEYPLIGRLVPGAIEGIKAIQAAGHTVMLWTMRSGGKLDEAVAFCREHGVEFDYVNVNPSQCEWTQSPKLFAVVYIDDAALGCPLIHQTMGRPYVDWNGVMDSLWKRFAIKRKAA